MTVQVDQRPNAEWVASVHGKYAGRAADLQGSIQVPYLSITVEVEPEQDFVRQVFPGGLQNMLQQNCGHPRHVYKGVKGRESRNSGSRDGDQDFQALPLSVQEETVSRQDVSVQAIRNGGQPAIVLHDQVLNKLKHISLPRI